MHSQSNCIPIKRHMSSKGFLYNKSLDFVQTHSLRSELALKAGNWHPLTPEFKNNLLKSLTSWWRKMKRTLSMTTTKRRIWGLQSLRWTLFNIWTCWSCLTTNQTGLKNLLFRNFIWSFYNSSGIGRKKTKMIENRLLISGLGDYKFNSKLKCKK